MMVQLQNPQCSYFLQHANKMRQSGTLCDVVIVVGRQTFQAHRLVLAIASKRLEDHFASRGGSQRQHCTLDTLSSHTFRHVLDYAYAETLEVSVEDLHGLQRAAQLLEMHQLGEQCRLQLETLNLQVTDSNKKDRLLEKVESSETSKSSPLLEDQLDTEVQAPSSSPHYKKPRPDDTLVVAMPPRVSVIASTTARQPNPLPFISPRLGWNQITSSPRMAVSSTDFLATQSLHPSEHLVACPLPFSAPMYPLFSPTPLPQFHHDSIMGYTGIIHPFHHALPTGPQALGIPVKHGLPGNNSSTGAAQMNRVQEDKERKPQRRTDKTFQCRPQVKDFLDSQQLQMHDVGDSEQSEVSLGCKYCGRCFGDESSLRTHRRVHNGEKPYQCKRCPKRFSLKHQLDTHYRVHTGEKPFECRLCGQRSRDYSAMIKHLRTHGGAAPYQCTVCLEFCSSQAAMQKHIKDHPAQDFPADWTIHSTYLYNCHS